MTVNELIMYLSKMPQDAIVKIDAIYGDFKREVTAVGGDDDDEEVILYI